MLVRIAQGTPAPKSSATPTVGPHPCQSETSKSVHFCTDGAGAFRQTSNYGVGGLLLVALFPVLTRGSSDEKTNEPEVVARAGRSFVYGPGSLRY
jgi:hypothetical protein